ncbi:MATE family efflux transporter [Inhella crocodyli]|uniref:MATE family efflux transporter n=1 Tax=Inhella crocodyli TaxID=2499851 RepID=A0A437LEA5_9BURK|nr:MATE family efflux transporter [Inhella crocodyli]RVT83674.1 MATE family efflux transporter [Inhella crocodyli]
MTAARRSPTSPRLWPMLWPLFVELALGMAVGLVATALAARVSDAAAGAFALANQLNATVFIVFRIVGAGIGVVITQALGQGAAGSAERLARAALGASTWIGLVCAAFTFAAARPLLQALQAPADLLPLALPFLQWLAPAMLLDAWNASMGSVMRAHLRSRDTLMVLIAQNALQLALALAWMPRFGLVGFAWAVMASRLLALLLHTWLWRARLGLRPGAADWWRWQRAEVAAMLHIGLPGAAENIAWRLAFMVSIGVVATMGSAALAAHAYTSQVMHFILLGGLAIGLSMEILVGHLIGAGRLREANRLLRRALAWGLASSVGVSAAAALAGPWLMRHFTQDPAILSQCATLLWLTVLLEPGRTFNLVVINALRAAGDARYPVAVGVVSMATVLAGGSWLLGLHWGWGLAGVWLAYAADEWLRGLLMWRRWATLAWLPKARAARRRVMNLDRPA